MNYLVEHGNILLNNQAVKYDDDLSAATALMAKLGLGDDNATLSDKRSSVRTTIQEQFVDERNLFLESLKDGLSLTGTSIAPYEECSRNHSPHLLTSVNREH